MFARKSWFCRLLLLVVALATPGFAGSPCGEWSPEGSPLEPQESNRTWFRGIKAFSENDVWAVGDYEVNVGAETEDYTLTQHWDGTSWTIVPSPSPGLEHDGGTECYLYAVDGVASDDVWAVGAWKTQNVHGHVGWQPLTLHWDGSSWDWIQAPFSIPDTSGAFLFSVVAIASDDVWVGGLWPAPIGIGIDALVMHWDGSSWEVVPTPRVDYRQEIQGMAARGPDDIWAVGGSGDNRNFSYVIHWDGSSWEHVNVPDASTLDWLTDVTLLDNGEIWAVTDDIVAGPSYYLHYDGSRWEIVEAPLQAWSVEAIAPDDIWAGGWDNYAHWDGTSWTIAEPVAGRRVHDIDVLDSCDLWSAGFASTGAPPVERLQATTSPALGVELTPHAVTVRAGELLSYDITVRDDGPEAVPCVIWVDVVKPNGNPYHGNPIVGPKSVTLQPGQQVTRTISVRVPPATPPSGPYTLRGSIGATPGNADASSAFQFDVIE